MKKKRQIGFLGATAIAVASTLGGAQQVNALPSTGANVIQQQSKKDAVPVEKKQVRAESEKNRFGGFSGNQNPYKHIRKAGRNQRQLRKHLRQNPHQRSKYN
jgi:hypothetical protein